MILIVILIKRTYKPHELKEVAQARSELSSDGRASVVRSPGSGPVNDGRATWVAHVDVRVVAVEFHYVT